MLACTAVLALVLLFARMAAPTRIDVNAGTPDELARQLRRPEAVHERAHEVGVLPERRVAHDAHGEAHAHRHRHVVPRQAMAVRGLHIPAARR